MSLSLLQQQFLRAIYQGDQDITGVILPNGLAPETRLSLYRRNVESAITHALKETFEMVALLVGEVFFSHLVTCYLKQEQPESGDLAEFGSSFPAFLAGFPSCSTLSYLSDVARLDWYRHLAYGAADAMPIQASSLNIWGGENIETITLTLHPSCHLLSSCHPLDVIASFCQTAQTEAELEELSLPSHGCHMLVYRNEYQVSFLVLSEAEYTFLSHIQAGSTILEAMLKIDPAILEIFDLGYFLIRIFKENIIIQGCPERLC